MNNRKNTHKKNECPSCLGLKDARAATCQPCRAELGDTKLCRTCQTEKPLIAFQFKSTNGRPARPISQCYQCIAVRRKMRDKKNPHVAFLRYLRKRIRSLNLANELDKIIELFNTQKKCDICKIKVVLDKFHIDHDHATGKFRGLVCGNCNLGLGQFKDNPKTLRAAIKYLKKSRS